MTLRARLPTSTGMHTSPSPSSSVSPGTLPAAAVSIPVACERLGIGRSLIYRLIERGELRAVKLGTRTLIPVSEIARLLEPPAAAH